MDANQGSDAGEDHGTPSTESSGEEAPARARSHPLRRLFGSADEAQPAPPAAAAPAAPEMPPRPPEPAADPGEAATRQGSRSSPARRAGGRPRGEQRRPAPEARCSPGPEHSQGTDGKRPGGRYPQAARAREKRRRQHPQATGRRRSEHPQAAGGGRVEHPQAAEAGRAGRRTREGCRSATHPKEPRASHRRQPAAASASGEAEGQWVGTGSGRAGRPARRPSGRRRRRDAHLRGPYGR